MEKVGKNAVRGVKKVQLFNEVPLKDLDKYILDLSNVSSSVFETIDSCRFEHANALTLKTIAPANLRLIPSNIIIRLYKKHYNYSEETVLEKSGKQLTITHYPLREKLSEIVADNFRNIIKENEETDELNFEYGLISFPKAAEVLSVNDYQLKSFIKQGLLKTDNNIAIIKEYSVLSLDSLLSLQHLSYVRNDLSKTLEPNKIFRIVDKLIISETIHYHPQGIRKMVESKRVNYFRLAPRITRYRIEDFIQYKRED